MKNIGIIILGLFFPLITFSQDYFDFIPDAISSAKRSAVPVIAYDSISPDSTLSTGTAVVYCYGDLACAITCEHVVAKKDSSEKTIGYLSNIYISLNLTNDSSKIVRTKLIYADAKNDFAILSFSDYLKYSSLPIYLRCYTPSNTLTKDKLKEGESVLYVGYPFSWGIGSKNYPISRTGIISQLVKEYNYFLLDGFVQGGYSGSPVFAIVPEKSGVSLYLVGITSAFPKEFSEIYKKVKYKKDENSMALINPGFTIVRPMDEILKQLYKFGFK